MTQLGEVISVSLMQDIDQECPFKLESTKNPSIQKEGIAKDDRPAAIREQNNNGGTLGQNLGKECPAGWGAPDTLNEFHQPPEAPPYPRLDSKTDPSRHVKVKDEPYPYKVAAHHLIPGEASLAKSDLYKKYMVKDAEGTTPKGKKYKIQANIGYNVNGNHNGVWLPGNYGIRGSTSPKKGSSWRKIVVDPSYEDWCWAYMMECVRVAGGQFHDSHTAYSEAVKDVLDNMYVRVDAHQDTECPDCKDKSEVHPPYGLKRKLYRLSRFLRGKLRSRPGQWKAPWYTSDRFREQMTRHGLLHE
ncbi:MAG TPA: AHH domain-containing protein [Longimicrobium sp.]|nr:AHH domain-containing protein [Longimicrobium sp.]